MSRAYESLSTILKVSTQLKDIALYLLLVRRAMYCCFVEVGDLAMLQGMCHTRSIFDTQHRPCGSLRDDLHLHEIARHSRGLDMEDEVRQAFSSCCLLLGSG